MGPGGPVSRACNCLPSFQVKFKLDASLQLHARSFVQVPELDHEVDQKPEGNTWTALASLAECSEKVYACEGHR